MLLLSHAGIAVGTAIIMNGILNRRSADDVQESSAGSAESGMRSRFGESWLTSLGRRIDIRILILGALLPDIIDKPLGRLVYDTFGCRLYCHTLLFLLVLTVAGVCLYLACRRNWLLVLAFGVFTHLALDEMWLDTRTFFWPLQGLSFPTVVHSEWVEGMLHELFTSPKVYIPETLGLIILGWTAWLLVRRCTVYAFIRHGEV